MLAMAIFDPRKVPSADSTQLPTYGKKSIDVLLDHYGKDKPALTLNDEETMKLAIITSEVHSEWMTFRTLLAKKPAESTTLQLKELITNDMLVIGLTIPVSTASVERSFSQMKLIKTRLRNSLSKGTLPQLMRIAIESPEKLTEDQLQEILDIWNKKPRKIPI